MTDGYNHAPVQYVNMSLPPGMPKSVRNGVSVVIDSGGVDFVMKRSTITICANSNNVYTWEVYTRHRENTSWLNAPGLQLLGMHMIGSQPQQHSNSKVCDADWNADQALTDFQPGHWRHIKGRCRA
ncbi:hypothetical protein OG21DRAFT_1009341 [Imleria badia]|nr:hypothetical protein OG21DRAFT_1009341 [Imleria badia]